MRFASLSLPPVSTVPACRAAITPRPVTRTIDGKLINHPMENAVVPVQQNNPAPEFKPQTFRTEDLDIPTFLRNRK